VLLLGLLTALVAYVLVTRTDALDATPSSAGVGAGTASGCPAHSAPPVADVSRATLRGLREDLRGVMFGRGRRLYEQGVVASSYAWSDAEPGRRMALPPGPRDPGGYELRWWAANGDDVGADVFVFAGAQRAREFFEQASSTSCRPSSVALLASSPPGAHDLVWRNPDRFAQEDVYLLRGPRVYRVAVVRAGDGRGITPAGRRAAFQLVNGLACALPGAECHPRSDGPAGPGALPGAGGPPLLHTVPRLRPARASRATRLAPAPRRLSAHRAGRIGERSRRSLPLSRPPIRVGARRRHRAERAASSTT